MLDLLETLDIHNEDDGTARSHLEGLARRQVTRKGQGLDGDVLFTGPTFSFDHGQHRVDGISFYSREEGDVAAA